MIPGSVSRIIGIDPGRKGALACLARNQRAGGRILHGMPLDRTGAVDIAAVCALLMRWVTPGTLIAVESGTVRPGRNEGGGTYLREQGALVGCAKAVAYWSRPAAGVVEVVPITWKSTFGLTGQGKPGSAKYLLDKKLALVTELVPQGCRVPSDGRSDALMIALFTAVREGWGDVALRG